MQPKLVPMLVRAWTKNGVDVHLVQQDHNGQAVAVGLPVVMDAIREAPLVYTPSPATFFLSTPSCQALMDELYRSGFRPTDAAASDELVSAMKAHVESLRRVAYTLLDRPAAAAVPAAADGSD